MALIDLILNLAALLLWWNWLVIRFDPLAKTSAASLVGTLRKAEPSWPKRWRLLAGLAALLLLRAFFYWQMSGSSHWTPKLQLGIIDLSFHLDPTLRIVYFARALLFSILSFSLVLGIFYMWVLLLSVVNSSLPDTDPLQKNVRFYFKWLDGWPTLVKLLLPFFLGAVIWLALHPILSWLAIVPQVRSILQLLEQSTLIGAATYLAWKYLIIGTLLLHLVNSYVYFGNHPLWNFINATANNMLYRLRSVPLRVGKVDFLPLIAVAFIFFATELVTNLFVTELVTNSSQRPGGFRAWFYHALPF